MTVFRFHGGCHGCTQQEKHGTEYCMRCCYFTANWDLPSHNNRPPTAAEQERKRLKNLWAAKQQRK